MLVQDADADFRELVFAVTPRPGCPGRCFRSRRLQLPDAVDELRQVTGEEAFLAEPVPLRGHLRRPEGEGDGQRAEADTHAQPAEHGIVEEHERD